MFGEAGWSRADQLAASINEGTVQMSPEPLACSRWGRTVSKQEEAPRFWPTAPRVAHLPRRSALLWAVVFCLHGLVVLCTGFLKENYLGVTNAVCFTWKPRSFSYHLLHHPSCSLLVVQAACCFKLPICSNGSIVELLVWSICTFVKAFYEAQRMPGHSWIPRNNFSQKLLNIIIKINELFY